tara:strand:- start:2179 stop:3435 length:1257 start_codon:yes stop_codon:yes gene_type:complete
MVQLSDDCFAFNQDLIKTQKAIDILNDRLKVIVGKKRLSLKEARGRILAEQVTSKIAVPPHDNAAVDGFALRFEDLSKDTKTELKIIGRVAAGEISDEIIGKNEAVRIFTGAPMPLGANTVLMQEDCEEKRGIVVVPPGIKAGANRRFAGEDITIGEKILSPGMRLRPQDIGLAASIGESALTVYKPLRVAIFSTGDEIRDITEKLTPGSVYDSNRYSLTSAAQNLGCEVNDLGILPDTFDSIKKSLSSAANEHELIITSGGVSTGEEDHVRKVVENLGKIHFWRLAIRPGRPLALGQIKGVPFIGLPGNPVAVLVTFMRFARPAILRLSGCCKTKPVSYQIATGFSIRKKKGRREWLRVSLVQDDRGIPILKKYPRDGAGILSSMVAADGLAELPEDMTSAEMGTLVEYLPFNEITL